MNNLFLKLLADNNQEGIKALSKIIAISVRNNIEDFHVEHLSDSQMKELNPLIRKGIYEALFTLANFDKNLYCKEWFSYLDKCVPPYWEESELDKTLAEIRDGFSEEKIIEFKSAFLNEQFKVSNVFYNRITGCIEIKPSFEFKQVPGAAHKHRDKISSQLRKEGYVYMSSLYGYSRRG